jgi:hypothetical protein
MHLSCSHLNPKVKVEVNGGRNERTNAGNKLLIGLFQGCVLTTFQSVSFSDSAMKPRRVYSGAEPIGASRTGRCRNVIEPKAPIHDPKAAKQT